MFRHIKWTLNFSILNTEIHWLKYSLYIDYNHRFQKSVDIKYKLSIIVIIVWYINISYTYPYNNMLLIIYNILINI